MSQLLDNRVTRWILAPFRFIRKHITILFMTIALVLIYNVFFVRTPTIQPFHVAASLEEEGITGQVVAIWLRDHAMEIQVEANSTKGESGIMTSSEVSNLDIDIAPMGISVRSISKAIQHLLGISPPIITGEITLAHPPAGKDDTTEERANTQTKQEMDDQADTGEITLANPPAGKDDTTEEGANTQTKQEMDDQADDSAAHQSEEKAGDQLIITVRVNGLRASGPITTTRPMLKGDLLEAAKYVYKSIDPAVLAVYYSRLGEVEDARTTAEHCLRTCDRRAANWAWLTLANLEYGERNYEVAEHLYKELLKQEKRLDPRLVRIGPINANRMGYLELAHVNLGYVYLSHKKDANGMPDPDGKPDLSGAYTQFKAATDYRPVALYSLGKVQLKKGCADAALATYDKFIRENPHDPLGHYGKARALIKQLAKGKNPHEPLDYNEKAHALLIQLANNDEPCRPGHYGPVRVRLKNPFRGAMTDEELKREIEASLHRAITAERSHVYANIVLAWFLTVKQEERVEEGLEVLAEAVILSKDTPADYKDYVTKKGYVTKAVANTLDPKLHPDMLARKLVEKGMSEEDAEDIRMLLADSILDVKERSE